MRNTAIVVMIAIIVIIFVFALLADGGISWRERKYKVRDGDTIWSIAEKHCPPSYDKRKYIWQVQQLNGIGDNDYLIPGMIITIMEAENNV